eukprot:289386-Chlamydomonas_euryale.AAC.1
MPPWLRIRRQQVGEKLKQQDVIADAPSGKKRCLDLGQEVVFRVKERDRAVSCRLQSVAPRLGEAGDNAIKEARRR